MRKTLLARIITTCSLVLALGGTVHAGDVTLAWDANTESDVAGYLLWYGTQPGSYMTSVDVGNRTEWTLTGLPDGQRYYFAVQAYNAVRNMSPVSTELSVDVAPDTTQSQQPGSGSTSACKSPRPGANWVCNEATGGWLPPDRAASTASSSTGSNITVPCTSTRPGPDWVCNTKTGGWLPPGHPDAQAAATSQVPNTDGTQGEVLYLFQSGASSALTGWVVLLPDSSAQDRFDVYRKNAKIGQWSAAGPDGGVQLNCAAGTVDLTVAGAADLVAWRPSTGIWYVLKSADGSVFSQQTMVQWGYGAAKDVPVPGDYDGDGKIDLGVWRPSIATWYVLKSSEGYDTQRYIAVQWGESGDAPVQGDYDGDGKTDLSVWRSSTSTSLVLKSTEGYSTQQCLAVQYGNSSAASPCSTTIKASGS
jgi:hypothetical protein